MAIQPDVPIQLLKGKMRDRETILTTTYMTDTCCWSLLVASRICAVLSAAAQSFDRFQVSSIMSAGGSIIFNVYGVSYLPTTSSLYCFAMGSMTKI
jgi:hypothetical protein